LTLEQAGMDTVVNEPPITYKPYAGVGLGFRFSPKFFWMIEYQGYFYKFPETEPFQREVSVSFAFKIGKK
jgi:alpha-acetolactate decarboxylase